MSNGELPEGVRREISSYVQGLLEKRQRKQEEYNDYVAELQSSGAKVRSSDRSKLKRQQRNIERLDNRLERRGFISGQDLQVTSKTIEIGSGLAGVHPKAGFQPSPQRHSRGGGGGETPAQPWDLLPTNVGTSESPSWQIRVQAGTLNNFLPTNWEQIFSADNTSLYYAKAIINTNGRSITSVSINITTSPASPQEPQPFGIDNQIEYLFGLFYEGKAERVIGEGNITLNPATWLTVSASPPAQAGELPYEIYYRLQ